MFPKAPSALILPEEQPKRMEEETPDAGMYEPYTEFGDIRQKMTLGGKYKQDFDNNPPPGYYDPSSGLNLTKPKPFEAFIKTESGFKVPKPDNPEAGQYDPHTDFGSNMNDITFGSKYEPTLDSNPPPGFYSPETADSLTKPRAPSALIKEENGIKVNRGTVPDSGMYDPYTPFGSGLQNITMGEKYKEKLNENPPPGYYDADDALNLTKPAIPSAFIKEDCGFKREQEPTPDGGMYEPHQPFGLIP